MTLPAIAIFTYNRPEKTRAVLEAIEAQNAHKVYIYCDGPKNDEKDRRLVQKNLDVVNAFSIRHKIVKTTDKNKGLSASIIDGITHGFMHEERLIVLEDDCLPFPNMLQFMNDNLNYWENCKDIFSISAYHFMREPYRTSIPFDVFLSHRFLPWGWATWKGRWQAILDGLMEKKNPYGSFCHVPDTAGRDLRYHAYAVEKNMVNSWAIPLGLITLEKGFRHVMPRMPLVNNTGMDDTGTNTGSKHNRIIPVTEIPDYSFPLKMCPDNFHDDALDSMFVDSMDVLLPPDWVKEKADRESEAIQEALRGKTDACCG